MNLKNKNYNILIDIIVAYRKFGFDSELAKKAMIELTIRRQNGLNLEYEKLIEDKVKKL